MVWLYVAATIFGGAFLIPMILGGLDSELGDGFGGDGVDVDLDVADVGSADLDLDGGGFDGGELDGGGDLPQSGADVADFDAGGNPLGAIFASLVSFRTIVFFSAFFGTSGLVFNALGYSAPVTLGTALLIGAIASLANSALFGLLKNSQPNSQISDRTLIGRPAKVVLPMDGSHRGRVRVDLSGQPQYLVARPVDDGSKQQFDVGASVVVVDIENGTALVTSLAELDVGEES